MLKALNRYFAKANCKLVDGKLPEKIQSLLDQLLDLLSPDGTVAISVALDNLFPLAGSKAATLQFQRLARAFNDVAKQCECPIRITRGRHPSGAASRVWLEGDIEDPGAAHTSELNAIPSAQLVRDQRGIPLELLPVVVLITFNEYETRGVLKHFGCVRSTEVREGITYNLLGVVAGMQVVHAVSRQGQGHAQSQTYDAIQAWKPAAVIAVGIAFGIDQRKQQIGDVLVSEFIRGYELARINADGSVLPRGGKEPASQVLINRFIHLDQTLRADKRARLLWPELRFGTLLSGNKLIDNAAFRAELLRMEPSAIGGEMEGSGIQLAADRHKVDWLVVKAICDWADGHKNTTRKEQDQELAGDHAALVVKAALELGCLFTQSTIPSSGSPHKTDVSEISPPSVGQMNLRDTEDIPAPRWVRDTKGALATLKKEEGPESARNEKGLEVLPYLLAWVASPDSPPLFALLGEYGMGKTVTCQRLAKELDQRRKDATGSPLPLYFDLRHVTGLDKRVPTLRETLEECMERGWRMGASGRPYSLEDVIRWGSAGAVLIIDGLDEVLVKLRESDGQTFTRNLLKLVYDAKADDGQNLKVLLSCRTQYFRTLRDQKSHFTGQERSEFGPEQYRAMVLLPLSGAQVESYLETVIPDVPIARLMETIRSVSNLGELTERPYTLRLISELLPDIEEDRLRGRPVYGATLYRKMVLRWLERDNGKHHIQAEHKLLLAANLAAFLWRSGGRFLAASEIEAWFHEWLAGQPALRTRYRNLHPEQLEEDLRTATFLKRIDYDAARSAFGFAHTSLQEYFLAEYIVQGLRQADDSAWELPSPSRETLDFIGQILAEESSEARRALFRTLETWKVAPSLNRNTLLLRYAMNASRRGWPHPSLHSINLAGANLESLTHSGAHKFDLAKANFSNANLRSSLLYDLKLDGAVFDGADLRWGVFEDCAFQRTSFVAADLLATKFRGCEMEGCSWTDVRLYRTQFSKCKGTLDIQNEKGVITPRAVAGPDFIEQPKLVWMMCSHFGLTRATFSPDLRRFLTIGSEAIVRVWDATSGEMIHSLIGHKSQPLACDWTRESEFLTGDASGSLIVWSVLCSSAARTIQAHSDPIIACKIWTERDELVSASSGGEIKVWDAESGAHLRTQMLPERLVACSWHDESGRAAMVLADGRLAVWSNWDGTLRVTELSDERHGILENPEDIHDFGSAQFRVAVSWCPSGNRLAVGDADGALRVWNVENLALERSWQAHETPIIGCSWLNESTVWSADEEGLLRSWNTDSGALHTEFEVRGRIHSVVWDHAGNVALCLGREYALQTWDLSKNHQLSSTIYRSELIRSCSWSANGARLLSCGGEGDLFIWDAVSGLLERRVQGTSVAWAAMFLDGSERVIRATVNGEVEVIDVKNGDVEYSFNVARRVLWACSLSPCKERILIPGKESTVEIRVLESGSLLRRLIGLKAGVTTCHWHPGGNYVAASDEQLLAIWRADRSRPILTVELPEIGLNTCQWSQSGIAIAVGEDSGHVTIFDSTDGSILTRFVAHNGRIFSCAWSFDDGRLLTAGEDGVVRIWDTVSSSCVGELVGHEGRVLDARWSPDASQAISVADDGSMRLWEIGAGCCSRVHAVSSAGHAVWKPDAQHVLELDGDAWEYLGWNSIREGIGMDRVPVE